MPHALSHGHPWFSQPVTDTWHVSGEAWRCADNPDVILVEV